MVGRMKYTRMKLCWATLPSPSLRPKNQLFIFSRHVVGAEQDIEYDEVKSEISIDVFGLATVMDLMLEGTDEDPI
jgi:hypothetical protein